MGFFENIFGSGRYNATVYESEFPKATKRTIYLGRVAESTQEVHFDVDLLAKHTVIAGITGGGKTVAGNVIIEGAVAAGASVLIIDPTVQWTGIIKENSDADLKQCYDTFKLHLSDTKGVPTNIFVLANDVDFSHATNIATIMQPGVATVALVHKLTPKELDRYLCEILHSIRNAQLEESKELKLLIVFDEVHCILPTYGGTGSGFLELERATREFRSYGVGLLLLSQVLEDFIGSIRANINTEVQMRTTFDADLAKARLKYGDHIADSIMRAQTGTGLFHNADFNAGAPFFLALRPPYHNPNRLPEKELQEYLTLAARISQLRTTKLTIEQQQDLDRAQENLMRGKFSVTTSYLATFEK